MKVAAKKALLSAVSSCIFLFEAKLVFKHVKCALEVRHISKFGYGSCQYFELTFLHPFFSQYKQTTMDNHHQSLRVDNVLLVMSKHRKHSLQKIWIMTKSSLLFILNAKFSGRKAQCKVKCMVWDAMGQSTQDRSLFITVWRHTVWHCLSPLWKDTLL